MEHPPHSEYSENLVELALGILTGRARAATLAHVDACPPCAQELEQLARTADAVVGLAPECDPPVGFEVRASTRMRLAVDGNPTESSRADSDPADGDRRRGPLLRPPRSTRWPQAAAAAVAALVVGLFVGWAIGSPSGSRRPAQSESPVTMAALEEHGESVGRVVTYGGVTPWMLVTLTDSSVHGELRCQVITDNGTTHAIGTFSATHGYASWDAPLGVAPQDVRRAEVVRSNGSVIATASLR